MLRFYVTALTLGACTATTAHTPLPAVASSATKQPCHIVEMQNDDVRGRDSVARALEAQPAGLHACFRQLEERKPGAVGKAVVQFGINPDGRVAIAVIQGSTVGDYVFSRCLANALTRIPFPDRARTEISQVGVTCEFSVP